MMSTQSTTKCMFDKLMKLKNLKTLHLKLHQYLLERQFLFSSFSGGTINELPKLISRLLSKLRGLQTLIINFNV